MKEIKLTKGQVALVDDEDFERVSKYKWYAGWHPRPQSFTARRTNREDSKRTKIFMHRQIMNAPPGKQVDHRNHDTLDNRKANLRICTSAENNRNQRKQRGCSSSQFKGVSWHKRKRKWVAYICPDDKQQHLGLFTDEIDAALAYNIAAAEMFGEFALLNDIPEAQICKSR